MSEELTLTEQAECQLRAAIDALKDGNLESARKLSVIAAKSIMDAQFIRAGHKPEVKSCDHSGYSIATHGRHCPKCGTAMWDAGD